MTGSKLSRDTARQPLLLLLERLEALMNVSTLLRSARARALARKPDLGVRESEPVAHSVPVESPVGNCRCSGTN